MPENGPSGNLKPLVPQIEEPMDYSPIGSAAQNQEGELAAARNRGRERKADELMEFFGAQPVPDDYEPVPEQPRSPQDKDHKDVGGREARDMARQAAVADVLDTLLKPNDSMYVAGEILNALDAVRSSGSAAQNQEGDCPDCGKTGKTPETCWLPPHLCSHPARSGFAAEIPVPTDD